MLINIYHYKGGTGKTTVATSLAIALSKSWGRTLYVEVGPVPVGVRLVGAAVTAGIGISIFIAVAAAVAYLFSRVPHAIGVE